MATSDAARKSLIFIIGPLRSTLKAAWLIRRPQAVANANLGHDVVLLRGIGLHFLPQLSHVDAKVLGVGRLLPQLVQQEFVRQHLAGVEHLFFLLIRLPPRSTLFPYTTLFR